MRKVGFFARAKAAARIMFNAGLFNNARPDVQNIWGGAHFDSINQQTQHWTRETIIARARHVYANCAYARNGVNAIQAAIVGTCPRLQLSSKDHTPDELAEMEKDWSRWAEAINLGDKLRRMIWARVVDGEAFAHFCRNDSLKTGIKLDLFVFDSMRVTDPTYDPDNLFTDGVKVNAIGEPISYKVLKRHPNENGNREYIEIRADRVAHLFKQSYPEQRRGVSELQPVLDLFALQDRYSRAVVKAAERGASLGLVFHTDQLQDFGASMLDDNKTAPFIESQWSGGETVTLPEGWDVTQVKAEQPVNQYSAYTSSLLNQIGAGIGVPKILLQSSAENSNYSSARLDLQAFNAQIRIDRAQLVSKVLKPLFYLWLVQYATIKGKPIRVSSQFYFDQYIQIDPQKEAEASKVLLDNNLTTLAAEYSRRGLDWEEAIEQRAREVNLIKKLNLKEVLNE